MRISENNLDKCNTIEDLLDVITENGSKNYADIGNVGNNYSSFLSRHKFFEEFIEEKLPDFTVEEVLKFEQYFNTFKDTVHSMSGYDIFLTALKFENKKGIL